MLTKADILLWFFMEAIPKRGGKIFSRRRLDFLEIEHDDQG